MPGKTVAPGNATLQEMISKYLVSEDDRTPEEIQNDIIAANMAAESVDELFRELESAKDEFVDVPFICTAIEFRASTVAGTEHYAIIEAQDEKGKRHVVSCSAADVYSKLLKLQQLGVMDVTPVVIRGKETKAGFTVLKLERVSKDDFAKGETF